MLIHCSDEKGIILSGTNYNSRNNGNIVDIDQHVDSEQKIFFMRFEWTLRRILSYGNRTIIFD